MTDGDDGDDEFTVLDLINNPVITDADAVGVSAFEFFATGRARISLQLHHFIFNAVAMALGSLFSCFCAEGRIRTV